MRDKTTKTSNLFSRWLNIQTLPYVITANHKILFKLSKHVNIPYETIRNKCCDILRSVTRRAEASQLQR